MLIACSSSLCAQEKAEFQTLAHRSWHIEDGLPDQIVQALAQTPDNYLWLGTSTGLFRFDGQNFAPYTGPDEMVLRTHGVYCLLVASDGTLWIGTVGAGLMHYSKTDGARIFSVADGLINPIIRTLYQDKRGAIWVGTDSGIFKLIDNRVVRVDERSFGAHTIVPDRQGYIWTGGALLLRYSGDQYRQYIMPKQPGALRIKSLCQTRDGVMWVGTVGGLYRLGPGDIFQRVSEVSGVVRILKEDSGGRLWIGTVGNGLYVRQSDGYQHLVGPDFLPSNTILSLLEDQNGNMWVGTQAGLSRLSRIGMQIAHLPGASDSDFGTAFHDTDGTIWICSTHLFHVRHGSIEPYSFPGLHDATVRTMFREKSGALWLGTMGRGVYRIQPDGHTSHWQVGNDYLRAFIQTRDGSVWMGTDGGISRWHNGQLDSYHRIIGALRTNVTSLAEDPSGAIWIGTLNGLKLFRGDHFVDEAPMHDLKDRTVWALHEDDRGTLWIGVDSGIYRWKSGLLRHLHVENLLSTPGVYEILESASHVMWISGPTSVIMVSRRDLDKAVDNDDELIHGAHIFAPSREFQAAELYGGMQAAGALDTDGSVWFPTSQGILHILPQEDVTPPTPPPLVIDKVVVDGRLVDVSGYVDLPAGTKSLEISYSPILLSSQSGLRFRRLLKGFDTTWSGPTSARSSFYTNLAPGRYTYQAEAFYVDDPSHVSSVGIDFRQRPHFYRTPWFLAFCVGLSAALVWVVVRIRTHQVQARFHAVIEERSRLAREIHDTVIQGCTGISVLLEAYSSMPQRHTEDRRRLIDYAREQVKVTIDEARDAVWDLRHAGRGPSLFSDVLRTYAEQTAVWF